MRVGVYKAGGFDENARLLGATKGKLPSDHPGTFAVEIVSRCGVELRNEKMDAPNSENI